MGLCPRPMTNNKYNNICNNNNKCMLVISSTSKVKQIQNCPLVPLRRINRGVRNRHVWIVDWFKWVARFHMAIIDVPSVAMLFPAEYLTKIAESLQKSPKFWINRDWYYKCVTKKIKSTTLEMNRDRFWRRDEHIFPVSAIQSNGA